MARALTTVVFAGRLHLRPLPPNPCRWMQHRQRRHFSPAASPPATPRPPASVCTTSGCRTHPQACVRIGLFRSPACRMILLHRVRSAAKTGGHLKTRCCTAAAPAATVPARPNRPMWAVAGLSYAGEDKRESAMHERAKREYRDDAIRFCDPSLRRSKSAARSAVRSRCTGGVGLIVLCCIVL